MSLLYKVNAQKEAEHSHVKRLKAQSDLGGERGDGGIEVSLPPEASH